MASGHSYSVSFRGNKKNYYEDVSTDGSLRGRQLQAMVKDFEPQGLTLVGLCFGEFCLCDADRRPVHFSASLRGDFEIVSTTATLNTPVDAAGSGGGATSQGAISSEGGKGGSSGAASGGSALQKRSREVSTLAWHNAPPLAHSAGAKWRYQPSAANAAKIFAGMRDLASAWSNASSDKTLRPVFTVAAGPGTGKSRLLDEFPALCREVTADNAWLTDKLARAFIFKVSFENGSPFDPDTESNRDGNSAVGTRMVWQLADSTKQSFAAFQSRCSYTIDEALEVLSAVTGVPRSEQVVTLLIDGLQRLLPSQQAAAGAAVPVDPAKFRSAINAVSACVNGYPECVVGAIAATLTLPIESVFGSAAGGSQQPRIYLQPPALARPEDVIPDDVDMPLLSVLRDDMGGNGRALEILSKHLYNPNGDRRPFASVANDSLAEMSSQYRSWMCADGICELREPLLYAVVARRRLRLSDAIPGCTSAYWTVDKVCSLGLVRLTAIEPGESGCLEMAVILLQMMRSELLSGPLRTLVPDYEHLESMERAMKTWQAFEDFMANFRAVKVAAFQGLASMALCDLHQGAVLSAAATEAVVRVPPGPALPIRVLHPTAQFDTAHFVADDNRFDVSGSAREGPAALRDVVLNGPSAAAGDIFLRLDRQDRRSGEFIPELEVIACQHRVADVNASDFDAELERALGDRRSTSFFLFVTSSRVNVDVGSSKPSGDSDDGGGASGPQTRSVSGGRTRVIPADRRAGELVGYIDSSCFSSYFGSFAGRIFHLLRSIREAECAEGAAGRSVASAHSSGD